MPEFLKRLINPQGDASVRQPEGKRTVVATVKLPHGNSFVVVREDILQKGLSRGKAKQAA